MDHTSPNANPQKPFWFSSRYSHIIIYTTSANTDTILKKRDEVKHMTNGTMSTGRRALWIILGITAMILSIVVLVYPGIGIATLIVLLSVGMLSAGFMLMAIGFLAENTSGVIRALLVIVGLISLALSIMVLVYPGLGTATLIILLSIEVIVMGAGAIGSGLIGGQSGWVRAGLIIIGLAIVGLGIACLVYPGLAVATLVILLSISLLMVGTIGIVRGIAGE